MAVTLTVAQLRTALALDASVTDEVVADLHSVAVALVNREGAEDAPDEVSNEAAILTAAHLEDRIDGRLSMIDIGPVKLALRAVGSAVRLSGARAMLSPWYERDLPVEPED